MASAPTRTDADSLKRLEALRPAYERLRAERIRAEGEIERLTAELETARHLAREALGTDDEAEIRRMIETAQAENAARIESFGDLLRGIEADLARLAGDA